MRIMGMMNSIDQMIPMTRISPIHCWHHRRRFPNPQTLSLSAASVPEKSEFSAKSIKPLRPVVPINRPAVFPFAAGHERRGRG